MSPRRRHCPCLNETEDFCLDIRLTVSFVLCDAVIFVFLHAL